MERGQLLPHRYFCNSDFCQISSHKNKLNCFHFRNHQNQEGLLEHRKVHTRLTEFYAYTKVTADNLYFIVLSSTTSHKPQVKMLEAGDKRQQIIVIMKTVQWKLNLKTVGVGKYVILQRYKILLWCIMKVKGLTFKVLITSIAAFSLFLCPLTLSAWGPSLDVRIWRP